MTATTPTPTKPLTKAQASLLARLRSAWTLTCYHAFLVKRRPAWYIAKAGRREPCHPAPAAFLFDAGHVVKDGEPVRTMAGILQRFKTGEGQP